ncbi:MAG: 2-phosphosulfolactate phosphatase [Deinococcota bacterium]
MNIQRITLNTCQLATDTVVVIDVLRAFTTAAFAFAAGANDITLVSTVAEAFAHKQEHPHVLLMGEEKGLPIDGFDYGNSPTKIAAHNLHGESLVQRTSAGTQGVVRTPKAKRTLVTGLCTISATVTALKQHPIEVLTLVETGGFKRPGDSEDAACADLIEAMMLGQEIDVDTICQRVYNAPTAQRFLDDERPEFPHSDLEHAIRPDKFTFAMEVDRQQGRAVLTKLIVS